MKKLRGYIKDEHNYIIGNYRIWYELTDDKLWVYRKDNDEFEAILNMPIYWLDYLWDNQPNKVTELKFEKYLIRELGL